MPVTYFTGNLFLVPRLDALAHGVNCTGKMGLGIAAKFRQRWPRMFMEYESRCRRRPRALNPGDLFAWHDRDVWIYNLATQDKPGPHATLQAVQMSLQRMVAHARAAGVRRVGLPRVGCGLGGLSYSQVEPIIVGVGRAVDVDLVVVTFPEVAE